MLRRPSKKFIVLQPAVTSCECFCLVLLVSSRSESNQGGASISTFLNPNIPTRSARLVCLCVSVCWCARFVVDRTKQIYCFRFVLNGMCVWVCVVGNWIRGASRCSSHLFHHALKCYTMLHQKSINLTRKKRKCIFIFIHSKK